MNLLVLKFKFDQTVVFCLQFSLVHFVMEVHFPVKLDFFIQKRRVLVLAVTFLVHPDKRVSELAVLALDLPIDLLLAHILVRIHFN